MRHRHTDERWGESVKACIVVRPGHSLSAGEVVDWCRSRLASYKKPRSVEFLSAADVPRSVTGKILRGDLVQRPTTPDQVVQATSA